MPEAHETNIEIAHKLYERNEKKAHVRPVSSLVSKSLKP